ncbi:MAG: magnesium transporter [Elusimicrobiota bacterium]|nr:magnesium transporter [Elusimicrobiota bacterium]
MSNINLYIPDIKAAIYEDNRRELKAALSYLPAVDIADGWERFSADERRIIFKSLEFDKKVEVFERLDLKFQKEIIESLREKNLGSLLDDMASDERVDLFENLSKKKSNELFSLMKEKEVEDVNELMAYGEDTAGGKMTTEYVALKPEMTAKEALITLQKSLNTKEVKNVYALYSVDEAGRLKGGISLQRLIASDPGKKISELANPVDNIKVGVSMDQEEVARLFAHYDLLSVPVVGRSNNLLGVITIDDIVDVIQEEATEDMVRMAGTESEELLSQSVFKIFKIRWPWLFVSWLGGLAALAVISAFEETLAQAVAVAAFIPVIMGMGGNIGVQSSTIVVRGLAIGKIDLNAVGKSIFKEVKVGLALGISYGVLLGAVAHLRYSQGSNLGLIGLVAGMGIAISMAVASTIGALLPIIFDKVNIDPAVATGPMVTTTIDVIGLSIYFILATAILL